ncbi:hypothetical protein F5879DRAFT_952570 [Lentinula edodes]|uniref:uncharacterized protein n=1 Tax=Lentinula edodes TaxID=5353 RepID=UPI001E8CC24E|nr:uncharacterized protein C8R40DRAFT_1157195 [Lentinula edodes]KAH7867824.1 hypothetical protein C8R40DRAFT_1157195 [Lentinula edodes]KAJ3905015.1 hypothetical protein F5879DRAFT_952570 [Lentinula edodes]
MNALSQSSPRPVKITYSRKQKRNRVNSTEDSETRSAQESDISQTDDEETVTKPISVKSSPVTAKKLSDMKPPESVVPVASRSSGSSKRPRVDQDIPDNASMKSQKGHTRNKSSVASLPPSSKKKPTSMRGHKPISSISQQQTCPSESDFDDSASVADSIISVNRVRRSENERIEYFKNQPECGSLEPNRVKCLRCQKYVALGKQTTYSVRPWEKHRARCDLKPAVEHQASPDGTNEDTRSEATHTSRTRKTEEERKGILFADPNIQEVEKDKVLCKKCNSWIRLGSSRYDLGNWKSHSKACGAPIPSSRVATAERKLKLVNDERATSFGVNHVICAACNTTVALMNDVDYNLTLWDEHKAGCPEPESKNGSPESSSIPFPTQGAKAPASTGSSSTVVSPEETVSRGVKRRLEDCEVDLPPDDPDARPQNRPRTEEYVAPDTEPGVFGWFMMPFKSFVRGFKESLSKDASTSAS